MDPLEFILRPSRANERRDEPPLRMFMEEGKLLQQIIEEALARHIAAEHEPRLGSTTWKTLHIN